jgi:hypothetical protein
MREVIAKHLDPESCAVCSEVYGEVLTGGNRQAAIEPRNHESGAPTLLLDNGLSKGELNSSHLICCCGSASAATKCPASTAVVLGSGLAEVAHPMEVPVHFLWIIPRATECSVFRDMDQAIGTLERNPQCTGPCGLNAAI